MVVLTGYGADGDEVVGYDGESAGCVEGAACLATGEVAASLGLAAACSPDCNFGAPEPASVRLATRSSDDLAEGNTNKLSLDFGFSSLVAATSGGAVGASNSAFESCEALVGALAVAAGLLVSSFAGGSSLTSGAAAIEGADGAADEGVVSRRRLVRAK